MRRCACRAWSSQSSRARCRSLWRAPGLSPAARLAWASLLWLWVGGLDFSADARVYALLFLLATAQTIAFARLLAAPDRRAAFIWAALAALAGLAHYFALFLGLAQGVLLVAVLGPRAVLALWPAGFALAAAGRLARRASAAPHGVRAGRCQLVRAARCRHVVRSGPASDRAVELALPVAASGRPRGRAAVARQARGRGGRGLGRSSWRPCPGLSPSRWC